jgi:hypothetical protein
MVVVSRKDIQINGGFDVGLEWQEFMGELPTEAFIQDTLTNNTCLKDKDHDCTCFVVTAEAPRPFHTFKWRSSWCF